MDHIGIDVHRNASQGCIRTETGQLIERRVRTDRESFAKWLGKRDRARILIESSTESEWVARCLEELGYEVIVADPNFAPMHAQRSRKVKTARRIGAQRRAVRFERKWRYAKRWCKRGPGTSV